MNSVIVYGSLNMDLSIAAERMPKQGETLAGEGFCTNPGGKGANQAVAAAKARARTLMFGAIGDDVFGPALTDALAEAGVACSGVKTLRDTSTGVAVILRTAGDNRIVLDHGANGCHAPEEMAEAVASAGKAGDMLLCQMECDLETTSAVLHAAHAKGMRTLLNVAPPEKLPSSIWSDVDIVCVNETECEALVGILPADEATTRQALAALVALGAGAAVITLGGKGSAALQDGKLVHVPADRIEAVDTTAAGDTYIGYLAQGYVSGLGLDESMQRATHAAGLTATRVGAQQAIPAAEEVDALFGPASGNRR
ncbi:MAG: ribokinase [Atopobiaceae bacterium]